MSELNPSAATTTNIGDTLENFSVSPISLDAANPTQDEFYHYFSEATTHFGYYFTIPEIYSAANALATWAVTRGYTCQSPQQKVMLDNVRGLGKDNFIQLMWNHLVVKLIVGDSFQHWKRKDDILVNIIPISPERVRLVYGKNGLIKRYDVWDNREWKPIKVEEMLHSANNRIGDQIHGTSQIKAAKKIIDARNEALDDERIIKHRDKALGVVKYSTDKEGKILSVNAMIEKAIKNGDMVGIPEGVAEILPWPSKSSEDRTGWIQYLENFFYQIFGVPRSIASSDGTSEVGGKMGHVIFEPIYTRQQVELEADLWNQQQFKVKFNRPPSLGGLVAEEEAKNTGQTNIQPNDSVVNLNRE